MRVAVAVPFRSDCLHRQAAWAWVRGRLEVLGFEVLVGACAGPWVKAVAVNDAIRQTDADIIVVHDADVWTDGLVEAVDEVRHGAAWAVPHAKVHRLTEEASRARMSGVAADDTAQKPYRGHLGGGVTVLPRETWERVPMDPRFTGWGQEDDSWAIALKRTLGAPWRGDSILWHLWHPPQQRVSRQWGSVESRQLFNRYRRAKAGDLDALLAEARAELGGF
jgi:hypothetical protein